MPEKKEFYEREDGFWEWDTPGFTFLIGDTNEVARHVALWVTPVVKLSYKMVERIKFDPDNPTKILDGLKKEAKVLVVKSKVIGGAAFLEYLKDRQEAMDELMAWTSMGLTVPGYIERTIH
jgi:hypothetical protein